MIEIDLLYKTVRDATDELSILSDTAFRVERGEILAIVDASGSGESTLLGLLVGLGLPTLGSVKLLDNDLFKLDEDGRVAVRGSHVGFVLQLFQLLPHLTALENVMLPLELQGDTGTTDMRRRAMVPLERVGPGVRLLYHPKTLSDDEQQRVALARAFVTEPDILFIDEPIGSLDTATGEVVIVLMSELNRSAGSTLVLVTYDRSVAARRSHILVIEAGYLASGEIVTEL